VLTDEVKHAVGDVLGREEAWCLSTRTCLST